MVHQNTSTERLRYENDMSPKSPFPEYIETDRLQLKRLHPHQIDVKKLHSLYNSLDDPETVFEYCSWSHHRMFRDTFEYLQERIDLWEAGSKAEYVVIEKKSGEYAGATYLDFSSELSNCTLGIWLRKPFWGQRLSGERADALLDVAFNEIEVNYVEVGCLDDNQSSRAAIEEYLCRYNGSYYGTKPVDSYYRPTDSDTLMHHEYVVTREQYTSEEMGLSCMVPGVTFDDVNI